MRILPRMAALFAVLTLGAACSEDGSGPGGGGDANVTVHLTDAPGDVLAAVVTIEEVYLQGGANGRVVLNDQPQTVNLVDLANSTTIVADTDVPSGTYGELRFVISGGYIEVETATGSEIYASSPTYAGLPAGATVTGTLQMPSLGQSGLKVDFADDLEITGDVDYLVDFDVSQSFGHQAGNSGMWVMHPVVKGGMLTAAGSVDVTLALGAGITLPTVGGVALALTDFKASLDGEEADFVLVNGVATASFDNLLPGTYELTLVGPAGLTFAVNPVIPLDVDVAEGGSATVAFTIITAS